MKATTTIATSIIGTTTNPPPKFFQKKNHKSLIHRYQDSVACFYSQSCAERRHIPRMSCGTITIDGSTRTLSPLYLGMYVIIGNHDYYQPGNAQAQIDYFYHQARVTPDGPFPMINILKHGIFVTRHERYRLCS
jgi:hypothetical protein